MRWQWILAALATGVLSTLAAHPAGPEGAEVALGVTPAVPVRVSAGQGRALLASGQVQQAERLTRTALADGADDAWLCLWGEIRFRRADFAEASKAFESAATLNQQNARAWWGLGRIEEIRFRKDRARALFAKAYGLDPRDTDIVLSYLDGVADQGSRAVLLRNVIALSRTADPDRAARAAASLEIDEHLGGRVAARLVSPYTSYRVPLSGFRPAGAGQDGLIVNVRVNGGKPLRLVLDTGARSILIDGRAAKNLGLEPIVASQLGGFGDSGAGESQVALARSLTIGDIHFEDCLIEVSRRSIMAGADGILGAGIFEHFQVRVDPRAHAMELTPADQEAPRLGVTAPVIGLSKLLLVKTAVAGKEGWFLLDTGAAYSTVARELLPSVLWKGASENLIGVGGPLSAYRLGPLSLGVGARTLIDLAPVALDLAPLSRREGIEISGVLGYSALGKGPFTLDFRRGLVSLE